MMLSFYRWAATCVALGSMTALGNPPVLAGGGHAHEGDFIVGVDGNGDLAVEADFDENFFLPAVAGLLNGWASDDPGFLALDEDEPDEDFFRLGAGANVRVEVVSVSPAFQAWTPGFADQLDAPGDLWTLGGPTFDEHPTWHIDSTSQSFNAQQMKWFFSFRLIDVGSTGYGPSPVYTVGFSNVDPDAPIPTMSQWSLVILALLLLTGGALRFGRARAVVC
jgi:hypothetical protein